MLEPKDIELAVDKKYTDFSIAIKQELANKIKSNPIIQSFESDFDRMQKLKDIFAQINSTAKEPE
jgi:hypothetical protein